MPGKDKENITLLNTKITELEKINKKLQQDLENLNKAQIKKSEIYKFLADMLGADVSDKVLVDVTFNENKEYGNQLKILGRPPVLGSATKQMRHVTPYSFIEHIIGSKIYVNHKIKKNVLKDLMEPLKLFTPYQEGMCLLDSEYEELKNYTGSTDDFYNIKMNTVKDKTIYYLINEDKLPLKWDDISIFSKDQKKKIRDDYGKKIKKFIDYGIDCLQEAIQDENTLSITCEALSRFILTLFNQRIYTSFPEEGNTLTYEIRLYKNKTEALVPKNKDYEILTHAEINNKISNAIVGDYDDLIRIVNNEGPMVKKIIKALETISKIIVNSNYIVENTDNIKYYNDNCNIKLKTPKSSDKSIIDELKKYNQQLTEHEVEALCHYHIAKLLYFVFDFKPLEEKVFVSAQTSYSSASPRIQVFPSADSNKSAKYCIQDGKTYREDQINDAKGYNKEVIFRSETLDQSLLAEKAFDHVYTSIMSFPSFINGFNNNTNYSKSILEVFTKLVAYDYKISFENFFKKINSICKNINIFQDDIDTLLSTSGEVETGTLYDNDFDFI